MARRAGLWLLVGLTACGGGKEIEFCSSTYEALFDPEGGLLFPFPSDWYARADAQSPTGRRLDLRAVHDPMLTAFDFLPAQLNRLDGFGTSAALAFGFSRELGRLDTSQEPPLMVPPESLTVDAQVTVTAESPVLLVGVDRASPDFGRAVPLLLEYLSDVEEPGPGRHLLLAEPAFALRPKTRYAAVLTRRAQDFSGMCAGPSSATRELLSGRHLERYGLLAEEVPDAVDALQEAGFIQGAGDISAISVFTTQSIEDELLSAADQVLDHFAQHPPEIVAGSLLVTPLDGDADLLAEITGRFAAPRFQSDEGYFVPGGDGPVMQGLDEIEFELLVPRPAADRQPPFPVIIYQHGLLGHKEEDRSAKRSQTRAGFASLAIDAPLHGSRRAKEGWELTNFFGIDLDVQAGEIPFDMEKLRDNFRQAFLDVVSAAELAAGLAGEDLLPAGAPDGVFEIAASPVYLSGHSLGGIIAAGAGALSERIEAVNICAGGGSLPTNLFMRSSIFGSFIDLLSPEGTRPLDVRRFMPVLQVLTERGDPVNLARLLISEAPKKPKPVLLQEVLDDAYVPNSSSEALARALGLSHLEPVLRSVFGLPALPEPASSNHPRGVSAAFFQFDVLSDGQPAEHTEIYADSLAQEQWIHFFSTLHSSGQAQMEDPYRVLGVSRP